MAYTNISFITFVIARGFVRAESGVVVFLQKLKDARRVYANVLNAKTNCDGFKREGMACPSGKFHKKLYEQFYQEINIDPRSVSYIEAHGTGTEVFIHTHTYFLFSCNKNLSYRKINFSNNFLYIPTKISKS